MLHAAATMIAVGTVVTQGESTEQLNNFKVQVAEVQGHNTC